jgi:hypothetical protein
MGNSRGFAGCSPCVIGFSSCFPGIGLPVVVDDPPAIAQALLPAFEHGLEYVALIELGVADERDHATFRTVKAPAMGAHVVLNQRREQRLRDAQADGAGGEIDVISVLGARLCAPL